MRTLNDFHIGDIIVKQTFDDVENVGYIVRVEPSTERFVADAILIRWVKNIADRIDTLNDEGKPNVKEQWWSVQELNTRLENGFFYLINKKVIQK